MFLTCKSKIIWSFVSMFIFNFLKSDRWQLFSWLTWENTDNWKFAFQKRWWNLSSMCVMCRANDESIRHLFSECPFILTGTFQLPIRNWQRELNWIELNWMETHQWIVQKDRDLKSKEVLLLAMERCAQIFRE